MEQRPAHSRLLIIHYHLNPGGVTSVIALGVKAMINHLPEIREITLLAGDAASFPENLRRELSGLAAEKNIVFRVEEDPDIAYRQPEPDAEPAEIAAQGRGLADKLLGRWGGALWWVHNYHIAKNVVFTQALLWTAANRPEQPLLFQIHDFPESGRPENYSYLQKWIPLPLYPVSPSIQYAVINRRDYKVLREAGIPDNSVSFLPNPVEYRPASPPLDRQDREKRLDLIAESWGRVYPAFRRENPLVFYPVRTIRRKNILEAGLLARISPRPFNLVVTLPGVSAQEAAYSRLVEGLYRLGDIPGLWGTGFLPGPAEVNFGTLLSLSALMISTSVQEGFGYLFIDGLLNRKPLFVRRLEVFDEISAGGSHPLGIYDSLFVPFERDLKAKLKSAYAALPEQESGPQAGTAAWLEGFLQADTVDFSYLPADTQTELLRRAGENSGYRKELEALNKNTLQTLGGLLEQELPDDAGYGSMAPALEYYSPVHFAERAGKTLIRLTGPGKPDTIIGENSSRQIERRVLEAFNRPENRRLLLQGSF